MRYLFLILAFVVSFASPAQRSRFLVSTIKQAEATPASPYTWTSGHIWSGSRDMWVYTPEGYPDNSDNYPLIVFGHGYGERSSNINDVLGAGAPMYIQNGDRPSGVIIACPQDDAGDYTLNDWDDVMDYLTSNYRIDLNRVYITGLSGGAFWCRIVASSRPAEVAAVVAAAGNFGGTWNWNDQADIGHYWIHGTADGTVTNGLQSFLNNANGVSRSTPFNTFALWGVDHTSQVWHDNLYNRKERTDATGTAHWDWIRYVKKFSKDSLQRATLHVESAEETQLIEDYRLAIQQVASLSSSSEKTALEGRLAALKTTIDAGGTRYIIDFGETSSSHPNINSMTDGNTSQSVSNLIDDEGNSSSIGFTIVSQFSSSPTSRMELVGTRANGTYFGFEPGVFVDGLRILNTVSTGSCKFTNLPAGTYTLRIYHTFGSGNYTTKSELSVTINSVTKTQYSEANNVQFIEYTGLSPSGADEIVIAMQTTAARNVQVCAMELFKH